MYHKIHLSLEVYVYQTGTKGAVTQGAANKRQICSKFAGFCFEALLIAQSKIRQIWSNLCEIYLQIWPKLAEFGQNWPDLHQFRTNVIKFGGFRFAQSKALQNGNLQICCKLVVCLRPPLLRPPVFRFEWGDTLTWISCNATRYFSTSYIM